MPGIGIILLLILTAGSGIMGSFCRRHHSSMQCGSIFPFNDRIISTHQKAILKDICIAGHKHRIQSRQKDQLALINIPDDDSVDTTLWAEGKCQNVILFGDWHIDDLDSLRPGHNGRGTAGSYKWYRNGVPLWPLMYQCMDQSLWFLSWPNYAIATPLYHIMTECKWRRPKTSIRKFFENVKPSVNLTKPTKLKPFVENLTTKFLDVDGIECTESQLNKVEDYDMWLKPIVTESLPLMLKSAKSRIKRCPAEIFLFIQNQPSDHFMRKLEEDLRMVIKNVKCPGISHVIAFEHKDNSNRS